MMSLSGVELGRLVSETDALTTRPRSFIYITKCVNAVHFRATVYSSSKTFYLWYLTKYQIKHMIFILVRINKQGLP